MPRTAGRERGGKPHGRGVKTFANGNCYEGDFVTDCGTGRAPGAPPTAEGTKGTVGRSSTARHLDERGRRERTSGVRARPAAWRGTSTAADVSTYLPTYPYLPTYLPTYRVILYSAPFLFI